LCGSPAIDQGNNFSTAATDQRSVGFARTFDVSGVPNAIAGDGTDIGAFEVQPLASDCDLIDALIALIENSLSGHNKRPLVAILRAAEASLERGDLKPGINQLQAFQSKVRTQLEPITPAFARLLLERAQATIDALIEN
jgi:hypothetical protein